MSAIQQELDAFAAVADYPRFLAEGRGACDGDLFPDDFTEDGTRLFQRAMRERARGVCLGCPFRRPCARWALEHDAQGMYGATTTQERRVSRGRMAML